jgi:hypothetical protein
MPIIQSYKCFQSYNCNFINNNYVQPNAFNLSGNTKEQMEYKLHFGYFAGREIDSQTLISTHCIPALIWP